jgi:hypothetical protein
MRSTTLFIHIYSIRVSNHTPTICLALPAVLRERYCPGFLHTAFALKAEGRLEQSDHFNDHIPRGELVELLTKALLYTEVETHCKGDGLITDCTTPFSLLKRHECSVEPLDDSISLAGKKLAPPSSQSLPIATVNGIAETPNKRKADAAADGDIREKRSRRSEDTEELKARSADRMLSLCYCHAMILCIQCFVRSKLIYS